MGGSRSKFDFSDSEDGQSDVGCQSSEEELYTDQEYDWSGGWFPTCHPSKVTKIEEAKRRRAHRPKMALVDNADKALENYFMFDAHSQLGTGGFSTVCRGYNKHTGAGCAIKVIPWPRRDGRLQQEIEAMQRLDHPNIIKLYETFESTQRACLVMEICEGGELFDSIQEHGNFSERSAANVMQQVFRAVSYVHGVGICHRDLKPENLLFQDKSSDQYGTLKLIDFGLATFFNPPTGIFHTEVGTPSYVAPEVFDAWLGYGPEVDLWSCGVVMYAVLSAELPFNGRTPHLQRQIQAARVEFDSPVWQGVSQSAKDLIAQLIVKDPKKRLTAAKALDDPWVQGGAVPPPAAGLMAQHVAALQRFRHGSQIKKVALNVAARFLEEPLVKEVRDIFNFLDVNADGTLTTAEMRNGLRLAGFEAEHLELQQIMRAVDADGSGAIDYTEFLAATLDHNHAINEGTCQQAFRVFDQDGDGLISPDELISVLKSKNVTSAVSRQRVKDIIGQVDKNGDGYIDFDEFKTMMQRDCH